MKAITYLEKLDSIKRVYDRTTEAVGTDDFLRGYFLGQLQGVSDMALEDNEITPMEFDEILSTKSEYAKIVEVKHEIESI